MNIELFFAGAFFRFLCLLLALVMATAPSASLLAQTNAAQQAVRQRVGGFQGRTDPQRDRVLSRDDTTLLADPTAPRIDTTFVSPGAIAVVVLRPAQIMAAPMAEFLPVEVATAAGIQYLGFDPAEVEEVVAFVDQINPAAPPEFGVTVKFKNPFRGSSIRPELRAHAQLGDLGGKRYLQSQHPMLPSFYGPNNKTLIVAPDATLRRLVESIGQPKTGGPILDRVQRAAGGNDLYAAVDVASLRPFIQMGLAQAQGQVPPDFQQFLQAPNLISAAELTFNLSAASPVSLVVHANDEAAAGQLEAMMADATQRYQTSMRAMYAEQAASEDPVQRAMAQYMERVSGRWTAPFMPQRDGASLVFFKSDAENAPPQQLTNIAVIGVLVALLLPAIQAAREAARRTQSTNNIKQIMLALLNHEAANRSLPAHANYSPEGQPLLSWRVHVLPYLEQQALYQEFHLDEPWDSEHNRTLIPRMPAVYANPNGDQGGMTNYLAVVGEPCMFNGTDKGTDLKGVTDGLSNTIALVEANADQAVEWTKPDDWEYDANIPMNGLGQQRVGVWIAGFADGSVRMVANDIDPQQLKAMFTRSGGEAVNPEAPQANPAVGPFGRPLGEQH